MIQPRCSQPAANPQAAVRREALRAAYRAIGEYERELAAQMMDGFAQIRGLTV